VNGRIVDYQGQLEDGRFFEWYIALSFANEFSLTYPSNLYNGSMEGLQKWLRQSLHWTTVLKEGGLHTAWKAAFSTGLLVSEYFSYADGGEVEWRM
jgi:hypothetical protein